MYSKNCTSYENFKLKLSTCAQSHALGTRTKFQLEIITMYAIQSLYIFVRLFWRADETLVKRPLHINGLVPDCSNSSALAMECYCSLALSHPHDFYCFSFWQQTITWNPVYTLYTSIRFLIVIKYWLIYRAIMRSESWGKTLTQEWSSRVIVFLRNDKCPIA